MTTPGQPTPERFRPSYVLPGTRIGAYVVRDFIANGGGQAAYLAESTDGRKVVLKVSLYPKGWKGSSSWKMHERFMRQVALFLRLRDVPGIAGVFAHDMYPDASESGYAYMVQEWVPDSLNILEWARKEPRPLETIIRGWMTLAKACGEMARLGICNRDLKPDNILVTPKGVPKIVDFDSGTGESAASLTSGGPGAWPGTKRYYSPELCNAIYWKQTDFQYGPQGDLHALGVIFYQVLTGEYPFDQGENDEELLQNIAFQVPERPSALNPAVPFGLEKVTMRLLQKTPQLRCRSGDELAAELEALLTTAQNWRGSFQTPTLEQRSSSKSSRATSSRTANTARPSTPSVSVGSAALDLAPSAIVLAGPSALAVRRPVLRLEASHPKPNPQPEPRRRARLLAAALALALVVSLFFGQHGTAGSFVERGTMLYGKAKTAIAAVVSMALTACAGLTGKVRTGDKDWLATCPAQSRKAIRELDIHPGLAIGDVEDGPNAIIPENGSGLELRDGPVEVYLLLQASGGARGGILRGMTRTGSDGASLRFTKLHLFQEGDDGETPSGPVLDVCGYASPMGYDDPGIPKAIDPPPASELHPGFVFVTTGRLLIHFAQ